MKLIMTIKMPHQKHFLKITLLFLKTQKEGIKIRVFLVIKTVHAIMKCMIVIGSYWPQLSIDSFQKIAYNLKSAYS